MISKHKPSLRCQAHWQNTQSQQFNQILPKSLPSRPAQTHEQRIIAVKLIDNNDDLKRPAYNIQESERSARPSED